MNRTTKLLTYTLLLGFAPPVQAFNPKCPVIENDQLADNQITFRELVLSSKSIALYDIISSDESKLTASEHYQTELFIYGLKLQYSLTKSAPEMISIKSFNAISELSPDIIFLPEKHAELALKNRLGLGDAYGVATKENGCEIGYNFSKETSYLVFEDVFSASAIIPIYSRRYDPVFLETQEILRESDTP